MTFEEWKSLNWSALSLKTIEEVENENMHPDDGRVPHVPFGFVSQKWIEFKSQMQAGDKIYYYSSSPESWKNLAGREGYALFRGEQLIDEFLVMMN
jgi:hypothetical protein